MRNVSVLIYTSQDYLPIADLSVNEFNKFSEGINIKKYLTSNSFENEHNLKFESFELLDCKIPVSIDSRQFPKVMLNALKHIESKYVLFMLEDMFLATSLNEKHLDTLIDIMDENEINHISLMSYFHDWKKLEIDYSKYGLENDFMLEIPDSYLYMFSLQPSIWKRDSLIEIFEYNQNVSIHEYDVSHIRNKKGEIRYGDNGHGYINTPDGFWDYGFKHCCFNRRFETASYCFDDRPLDGDYFLFLYSGAIRFGRFDFNTHNNTKTYITKFLEEKNIDKTHQIYGKFFP